MAGFFLNVKSQGSTNTGGQGGKDGVDGKSLEFNWNGTELGIRQEGNSDYQYVNLRGEQGLQGLPGKDGKNGLDGITPNITIGNVTTLDAGEQATVTREGTDENPVFNFGIPKGRDFITTLTRLTICDNNILNLTTDKWQKVDMTNNTTINLPQVDDFTEIHLFFRTNSELTLILPNIVWKNQPTIEANKVYEFVFTYIGEWIGGCICYN